MPYFLVTHTSPVEAEDETAAAVKAHEAIGKSDQLRFEVRSDEHNSRHIVIQTGKADEARPQPDVVAPTAAVSWSVGTSDNVDPQTEMRVSSPSATSPSRSPGILYGTVAGAFAVFYLIAHFFP